MPLAALSLLKGLFSFLGIIFRPLLNPEVWPAVAIVAAVAWGIGWKKGDAHGDRQCEARIERDRQEQDRKIREEGETTFINLDRWLREKDQNNALDKTLGDEARKDPDAGRTCGGIGVMQRLNRIKGAAAR